MRKIERIPAWEPDGYQPPRTETMSYPSNFKIALCLRCKENRNMPRYNTKCLSCCASEAYSR
jgi:hypothetical protein